MINRTQADAARATLDIPNPLEEVDTALVSAFYRVAARRTHPDAGGNDTVFAAVDSARRTLLAWLDQSTAPAHGVGARCHRCDGAGHLRVQRGFNTMRMQCPHCRGTGELDLERSKGTDE